MIQVFDMLEIKDLDVCEDEATEDSVHEAQY